VHKPLTGDEKLWCEPAAVDDVLEEKPTKFVASEFKKAAIVKTNHNQTKVWESDMKD